MRRPTYRLYFIDEQQLLVKQVAAAVGCMERARPRHHAPRPRCSDGGTAPGMTRSFDYGHCAHASLLAVMVGTGYQLLVFRNVRSSSWDCFCSTSMPLPLASPILLIQLGELDRLLQEVASPELHRLDAAGHGTVPILGIGIVRLDALEGFQPVDAEGMERSTTMASYSCSLASAIACSPLVTALTFRLCLSQRRLDSVFPQSCSSSTSSTASISCPYLSPCTSLKSLCGQAQPVVEPRNAERRFIFPRQCMSKFEAR